MKKCFNFKNRISAIDIFSGAGGLSLAAVNLGINLLAAVEIDQNSCETYRKNIINKKSPITRLYNADITNLPPTVLMDELNLKQQELDLISNEQFLADFENLYTYYKNSQFIKFAEIGTFLFMVFKIGKGAKDIKTFKWLKDGDTLKYVDNRSDPNQVRLLY